MLFCRGAFITKNTRSTVQVGELTKSALMPRPLWRLLGVEHLGLKIILLYCCIILPAGGKLVFYSIIASLVTSVFALREL